MLSGLHNISFNRFVIVDVKCCTADFCFRETVHKMNSDGILTLPSFDSYFLTEFSNYNLVGESLQKGLQSSTGYRPASQNMTVPYICKVILEIP